MKERIVFVGAGGVGLTTAFSLARKDPDLSITLFSKEQVVAYSQCGMPFVLDGIIGDFDSLVLYGPEVFTDLGLDVRTGTEVTGVDLEKKLVFSSKGDEVPYDKLIICTGAAPFIPPVPGAELKGVFKLYSLDDGRALDKAMETAKHAVIVGGGPIGMETAPAFLDRGIKLTIVERMPYILPGALDEDMASVVQDYLISKGARIIAGKGVDSINGNDKAESVTVEGEDIKADIVLLSAGIRPNVALAKATGLDIGVTGGIVVDDHFRVKKGGVTLEDVYAAGDCAEVTSLVTGKPVLCAVGSVAGRQSGFLTDILLGKGVPYDGIVCPTVTVIGSLHVGSVGMTGRACSLAGIEPVSFRAKGMTRARYYPGGKKIDIKLVSDGKKIVGGQMIGEEGVGGRINTLTLAIRMGATPEDLARSETCYAPPVSPMIDPLTYAAEMLSLRCKLKSKKRSRSTT